MAIVPWSHSAAVGTNGGINNALGAFSRRYTKISGNRLGDFVNVEDSNTAKGYDFTTGGVTVRVDYRITDHFAIGLFGSYAHTWTDFHLGSVDVDTGRGGLYATYFDHCFYINAAPFGGYSSYDTRRQEALTDQNSAPTLPEVMIFILATSRSVPSQRCNTLT